MWFYCVRSSGEADRSDPAAVISSIVRQLSAEDYNSPIANPLHDIYKEEGEGFAVRGLELHVSLKLLHTLVSNFEMTTIIIDGPDECTRETLLSMLVGLKCLLISGTGLVKIFVASRDEKIIADSLRSFPSVDVLAYRNTTDIKAFVRYKINRLINEAGFRGESLRQEEQRENVIEVVSRKADGM